MRRRSHVRRSPWSNLTDCAAVRAAVRFGLPRRIANLSDSKLGSSPPIATAPKYDPSRPHGCCSARRFDADQWNDQRFTPTLRRSCNRARLRLRAPQAVRLPIPGDSHGFHGDQDAHPFSWQRSPPSGRNPSDPARIRRLRRMSRREGCESEGLAPHPIRTFLPDTYFQNWFAAVTPRPYYAIL